MVTCRGRRTLRLGSLVLLAALTSCGEESGFITRELAPPVSGPSSSGDATVDVTVSGSRDGDLADLDPLGDPELEQAAVPDPAPTQTVEVSPPPAPTPEPAIEPTPAPVPDPVVIVNTAPVVLTAGQTHPVVVSIDDGTGARPADPSEITVTSQNPAIVTVSNGPQPGQIIIVAVNPGQTQVTVVVGNDTKAISVQVVPGIPVIRLGVNFEDIPSGGDLDYNDAVFCFAGKFAHDNSSVVSLAEQTVRINVTNRSGCDHFISIAVVDSDGTRREIPVFRSKTQPVLDMLFHAGSKLDVKMRVANECLQNATWVGLGSTVTVQGPNFGRPLVEILNDVCRTTGS